MNSQANFHESAQEAIDMAVSNLGQSLMQLVLQEVRALPDVWQKLPEYRQNEVIERIRMNVETGVFKAVSLIASQGCQKVVGELEKVTLADKRQAVITLMHNNEYNALHELYESTKQVVMIVLASPDQFTGGMDDVRGDPDQPDLDLNSEAEEFGEAEEIDGEVLAIGHDDGMQSDVDREEEGDQ